MFARHPVSSSQMATPLLLLAPLLLFMTVPAEAQQLDPGVCAGCISPAPAGAVLSGATLTPASISQCSYVNNLGLGFQCSYAPANGVLVGLGNPFACPSSCNCGPGYTPGPTGGCVPACAHGRYMRNDGTCTPCTAGTFSSGGAVTSCTQCDANTFSGDAASSCTPCGATSTSDPGSPSCTFNCPAGQFVQNNACTTCPAGTKSSGGAVTACNSCASGEVSSADHGSCLSCAAGASPDAAHSTCIFNCPAGQFVRNNACTTCTAGTYSVGGNVKACIPCSSNEVSSADHSSCSSCPTGSSPDDVHSTCIFNCPAGQFVQNNACTPCSAGTKSNGGSVTSCDQCPLNTFSAGGASSCTACAGGTTSSPGSSSCNQHCAAGQYSKASSCSPCAAGTYSGADATTCSTCPANTFSEAGASSCTACPNGGTCKAGSTHSSQCAPPTCAAGKYLDYGRCKTCPRGTFSSRPDSLYCEDCPADTYSDSGATHCTNCDTGYGCEARSAPGQCKRKPGCPPGQALSNRVCNDCPRKTYGPGGQSPCIACPKGYNAPRGSSSCTAHPTPSHYPRAQEVSTCPRDHMLCPVYGSTSLECIDVRSSLESCGGCVEVGTNSVGQDCSAIKNVVDVRCNLGRCEVSKCRANFEVSVTQDSCVVPRTARRPRTT
ncbi:hypothetical protein C8R47DRAFT_754572 [Mycena vitilis]|nr:hypothetical protein C8R47DRAFT_754572 [Mycena vitilis]